MVFILLWLRAAAECCCGTSEVDSGAGSSWKPAGKRFKSLSLADSETLPGWTEERVDDCVESGATGWEVENAESGVGGSI